MRERSFSITAPTLGVALDSQGKSTIAFAVTNSTARSLRGQMQIRPLGETKAEWLRLQGASEINFAPSETHQVTAEVQVPPGTAPGKYRFRLDACSTSNPDDDYTEGPVVSLDIGAAPPPKPVEKKPFPLWIIFVVSAIILIGVGLSVWLLQTRKETGPPPTPTPAPATPTPTPATPTPTPAPTPIVRAISSNITTVGECRRISGGDNEMDTDSGDVVTVAFSSTINDDQRNVYAIISYSCEEYGGNHTVLGVNNFKTVVWSAPSNETIVDVTCQGGRNFVSTPKPKGENHGFLTMSGIENSYWGNLSYRVDSGGSNDAPKVGTIGTVLVTVTTLPR